MAWSVAGLAWWLTAWRLAAASRDGRRAHPVATASSDSASAQPPFLTVFKPLPPLGAKGLGIEAGALASFISQLDEQSELLLGVHEADRPAVDPFIEAMRLAHPGARLRIVIRPAQGGDGAGTANPKIAWQRILAPEAQGDLWLWSDADIVAPPDFLRRARIELDQARREGIRMVTFPYVVRSVPSAPALFDALFVNVEFHPGVLLLRELGRGGVDFGLGAGMLFRREDFYREADWDRLEGSLADDFVLGQMLRPVRIGRATLVSSPEAAGWAEAWRHYLRWQKTVCWCRPGGFAAQILILPVLGWLAAVVLQPGNIFAWAGLLCMIQAEVFFAESLCREAGCRLRLRDLPLVEAWSLLRVGVWISCWLPWPVTWRQRRWWSPRVALPAPAPAQSLNH